MTEADASTEQLTISIEDTAKGGMLHINWGAQRDRSGNEVYSIGIYELRPCPG